MQSYCVWTFSSDLDCTGRPNPISILVPIPSYIFQRNFTHEDSILILFNVEIFQFMHNLQFVLCEEKYVLLVGKI